LWRCDDDHKHNSADLTDCIPVRSSPYSDGDFDCASHRIANSTFHYSDTIAYTATDDIADSFVFRSHAVVDVGSDDSPNSARADRITDCNPFALADTGSIDLTECIPD